MIMMTVMNGFDDRAAKGCIISWLFAESAMLVLPKIVGVRGDLKGLPCIVGIGTVARGIF